MQFKPPFSRTANMLWLFLQSLLNNELKLGNFYRYPRKEATFNRPIMRVTLRLQNDALGSKWHHIHRFGCQLLVHHLIFVI